MYGYIVLALVASAAANVIVDSGCPHVTPVSDFKLAEFGNGIWYEVARYPNNAEKDANCGETKYTLDGEGYKIKSTHVVDHKLRVIEGSAKLAEDAGNSGKIINSLPYGANGAITDSTLWILATDYHNYAIGYYCKYSEDKKSRQDFAWILSRSKKLEGDALAAVEKYVKESTVLEGSKFVETDFSDETCKINA